MSKRVTPTKPKPSRAMTTPEDGEHSDKVVLDVETMIKELTPNEMSILAGTMCKWYLRFHNNDPFILEEFRFDIYKQFKQLITERQKLLEQAKKTGELAQQISTHLNKEIKEGFEKVHARTDKEEDKKEQID